MAQTVDFSSLVNANCPLTWSFSSDVIESEQAISLVGMTGPSLSIFYNTDLDPATANASMANPFESMYTITLTGSNADPFELMCTF